MTRNTKTAQGMLKALVVAIAAGSLGLMGCGSEMSTAPVIGTSVQDEPGEMILPTKIEKKVETPRGFSAASLGGNAVNLTWASPFQSGLVAVIQINDIELARVPASGGVYLDTMGKPAGEHQYDLCFVWDERTSREVRSTVEIRDQGGNDGGRTDKDPELGN